MWPLQKKIVVDRDIVRLTEHKARMGDETKKIEEKILRAYEDAGFTPPYFKELLPDLPGSAENIKEVLEHLIKKGVLTKVKTDLYYPAAVLDQLWAQVKAIFQRDGELTTPAFKEATNLSRKYLIPVLEHFDAKGLTMRVGEKRVLRSEKS